MSAPIPQENRVPISFPVCSPYFLRFFPPQKQPILKILPSPHRLQIYDVATLKSGSLDVRAGGLGLYERFLNKRLHPECTLDGSGTTAFTTIQDMILRAFKSIHARPIQPHVKIDTPLVKTGLCVFVSVTSLYRFKCP